MNDRAAAIANYLTYAERMAADIAADKRLSQIRDQQTDNAWRVWIGQAIDPAWHKTRFDAVRVYLKAAEAGAMDPDAACDKAEALLRQFKLGRQMLADLAARWDASAQARRARLKRTRSKWPQAVADHLRQTVGGTKEKQWKALTEEGQMLTIDGIPANVYRDGRSLCYSSNVDGNKKISESTFRRRYLKAGKRKTLAAKCP
jgi:hypothetical protein